MHTCIFTVQDWNGHNKLVKHIDGETESDVRKVLEVIWEPTVAMFGGSLQCRVFVRWINHTDEGMVSRLPFNPAFKPDMAKTAEWSAKRKLNQQYGKHAE